MTRARNRVAVFTAATLAAAAMCSVFTLPTSAADNPPGQMTNTQPPPAAANGQASGNNGNMTNRTAANLPELNQATQQEVEKVLCQFADYALMPGGQKNLASDLVKDDQGRMKNFQDIKWNDVQQQAEQFQKDFKAKYGQDFNASKNQGGVFNDQFAFYAGDIPEAQLAAARITPNQNNNQTNTNQNNNGNPTSATVEFPSGSDMGAGAMQQTGMQHNTAGNAGNTGNTGTNTGAANGNGGAHAGANTPNANGGMGAGNQTMTDHGMANQGTTSPVVYVHVYNEDNNWRIDLPNQLDAQKLHDALLQQLTSINQHKSDWPSDVNQAYRQVTCQIFSAVTTPFGQENPQAH